MKKIKLKRPYYLKKNLIRFRRPQDWLKIDGKKRYSMWPPEEREIMWACDAYIAHVRANPSHVKGWLKRGIDKARMLKVKREIEEREKCRIKIQRENERGRAVSVF